VRKTHLINFQLILLNVPFHCIHTLHANAVLYMELIEYHSSFINIMAIENNLGWKFQWVSKMDIHQLHMYHYCGHKFSTYCRPSKKHCSFWNMLCTKKLMESWSQAK